MTVTQRTITALLVGKQDGCLPKLKRCLEELGLKTASIERANEVRQNLSRADAPEVVFADSDLAERAWKQVLDVAQQCKRPLILAARFIDHDKYLNAMEHGVFDFVVPPFAPRDLRHIVDSAVSAATGGGTRVA
jgi:DNA-binding NtrC family response regulator